MNREELDPANVTHDQSERKLFLVQLNTYYMIRITVFIVEAPLLIENGTFTWGEEEPVLENINIKIDKNNLVAVVGGVGSGRRFIFTFLIINIHET